MIPGRERSRRRVERENDPDRNGGVRENAGVHEAHSSPETWIFVFVP